MSTQGRHYARITFSKRGPARFVGHLDMSRAFDRAIRRSGLPVAYSEGFNPRAKLSFGPPLPVGAEGEAEVCLLELARPVQVAELEARLSEQLPAGLGIVDVQVGLRGRRSPLADLKEAAYEMEVVLGGVEGTAVTEAVRRVLALDTLWSRRESRGGVQVYDIRPGIRKMQLELGPPAVVRATVNLSDSFAVRPGEIVAALNEHLGEDGKVEVRRLTRVHVR